MRASAFFLGSVVVLAASSALADDVPPSGFHVEREARTGEIIGSSILLGVPYALSAAVATTGVGSTPELAPLYVPVVGPWITLGWGNPFKQSCCGFNAVGALAGLALVADGVMQTAGAIWLTVALASKKKVLVPDHPTFVAAPFASRGGAGFAVAGTF